MIYRASSPSITWEMNEILILLIEQYQIIHNKTMNYYWVTEISHNTTVPLLSHNEIQLQNSFFLHNFIFR